VSGRLAVIPTEMTQIRALPVPPAGEIGSLTTCLSGSEHELMATYRHPRRRGEFVAGRLAIKHALLDARYEAMRVCLPGPLSPSVAAAAQRMQVMPDPDGRPQLWDEDCAARTYVSIAHAAGWAAGGCSPLPIGIDIVDIEAPTAVPDDHPWLAGIAPDWRRRLRALLWGIRECLLKSGQIAAKTVWALEAVDAVPRRSASEIIALWPGEGRGLAPLALQFENKTFVGAFSTLSQSALLVMILMPVPPSIDGMHLQ
jgi:phosphopantetheinyl transferase (holo-ACP synthase)